MDRKRWLIAMPLLGLSLLTLSGCPAPSEPPSAPLAAPPARTASASRPGMSELPPDPRAARKPSGTATSGVAATSALPAKAVAGSALNKFFPQDADGYDRVFTQEKNGFAMANLKKGGKVVASLSINDCAASPSTRDKFKSSSHTIGGYPSTTEGGTAILVGDRYQVKIRATGGALSASDTEAWIQKFDLAGLAALK